MGAAVLCSRSVGVLDGQDHCAGFLCAARHAHAREDRIRCDAFEHRLQFPVHSTASQWWACAGDLIFRVFQFNFAACYFSEAIWINWRSEYRAVDWEIHRRIDCAWRGCLCPDSLAGFLYGPFESEGHCVGRDDRSCNCYVFRDSKAIEFSRACRITSCTEHKIGGEWWLVTTVSVCLCVFPYSYD